MKMNAYIAGTGMTRFGKFLDRGLKSLAGEAIESCLADAGVSKSELQAAYCGTGAAGVMTGQVLIPGEVALREIGIGRIPVVNHENACATSATAFQQAATMVTLGVYDVVLVVGFEKLFSPDKQRTISVFAGAVDVEGIDQATSPSGRGLAQTRSISSLAGVNPKGSLFMDRHAVMARTYMRKYGATQRHFAMVSAKNSFHGSLNPKAQYQEALTVDQVLAAPLIADPLTLPMCAPISDGAAALVLVSERKARQLGRDRCVKVLSSVLATGWDYSDSEPEVAPEYAARLAYEGAGAGPQDIDVVELHDASAPAEVMYYEHLGLAGRGEGVSLLETGATTLGGRIPVNPSGGLLRRGNPIGASGCGQLVELTGQLRGRCGSRQVRYARTALAQSGGGFIADDVAVIVVSILQKAA